MAKKKKAKTPAAGPPAGALGEQLLEAAARFKPDSQPLGGLLAELADDVRKVAEEPLTILPVAHHSAACALHTLRRLREQAPRVIFIEICEDLAASIAELKDCKLPVALQAFASATEAFPAGWTPLSVVAPLSEFSAEYQAIAFALAHKDTDVVFVDRSVDHVFQWHRDHDTNPMPEPEEEDADEEEQLHSTAVGIEVGSIVPSFGAFREALLENARVRHFSEWWDLYVEQATLGVDFDAWRATMVFIGSLFRKVGTEAARLEELRMRERYMWTRIKTWLREHEVAPADALYICGASHAAADVPEWGTAALGTPEDPLWEVPPRSETDWLYGFIPSSYAAIEHQFAHPRGTLALAETTWKKACGDNKLKPFTLSARTKQSKARKPKKPGPQGKATGLLGLMTDSPSHGGRDAQQLVGWCTDIVGLARKNRYLASTADAIAIYETSVLLAGLRGRPHPSPYDFVDAAITCLEKTEPPGRRDVRQLCGILLGGDRIGQVGYSSLPPLVRDIYDRLEPAGVKPKKTTITRCLIDFKSPEGAALKPCSELLWRLVYLLPRAGLARPIMGEKKLGQEPMQESWDIKLGGYEQRAAIQLAYEGVTVEQVLEQRLKKQALKSAAKTTEVLALAEDSILYLSSPRLTEELGERAVYLLGHTVGADEAEEVFRRVRRLVHYYRATPGGLPHWLKDFVAIGYRHYATLLPEAFGDQGTTPQAVAGMLGFLFTLESLALALGCSRSQVSIALQQAAREAEDPPKLGLLWAAEFLLQIRDEASLREEFQQIFGHPLSLRAFPAYLGGFVLALGFTPLVAGLAVELLGMAFAELPDKVLLPWLPGLLSSLSEFSAEVLPSLFKEAFASQPRNLAALDTWTPPWERALPASSPASTAGAVLAPEEAAARALLDDHRAACEAHAGRLGLALDWRAPAPSGGAPALEPGEAAAQELLFAFRGAALAHAGRRGLTGEWTLAGAGAAEGAPADASAAAARELLAAYPAALEARAGAVGVEENKKKTEDLS